MSTIGQALALFTGQQTGEWGADGYQEGTLLHRARSQARDYWEETVRGPHGEPQSGLADAENKDQ